MLIQRDSVKMAIWLFAVVATCVKMMFIPGYRSTDFEVHRNWLAITHSQPMYKWYFEETSEWTLDYPPLFAWFEYILSLFAQFVDPAMLKVSNLNYASDATIIFQRMSVIATDYIYYYAIREFHVPSEKTEEMTGLSGSMVPILLIFNVGLYIVDHIHFQYNGIMFGIMLLSITRILQERYTEGAFWFAVLLNMKHIFIYVAPAWFVYLVRTYCFSAKQKISLGTLSLSRFMSLASIVSLVFFISFGPFIYMNQFSQLLSRLFPFKRGLVHAYWAPNFWALYSGVDKALTLFGVSFGLVNESRIVTASLTGGMVQEYSYTVLPSVIPGVTFILVLMGMLPALMLLWEQKTAASFVRTIVLCAFASFLFGWHVHEKAVLMIIIPLTLLVMQDKQYAKLYLILATTGFYSLFPLLFTPFENILKVLLLLQSCVFSYLTFGSIYRNDSSDSEVLYFLESLKSIRLPLLNVLESFYIYGFVPLGLFNSVGFWALGLSTRLPFLPLMLTSVYCTFGIMYSWILFYRLSFQMSPQPDGSNVSTKYKRKKL